MYRKKRMVYNQGKSRDLLDTQELKVLLERSTPKSISYAWQIIKEPIIYSRGSTCQSGWVKKIEKTITEEAPAQ